MNSYKPNEFFLLSHTERKGVIEANTVDSRYLDFAYLE